MLRVTQAFFAGNEFYPVGKLIDERDNIVRGRSELFEKVETEHAAPVVEAATAAPGEKRTVKRVAKKKAE